MKRFLYKKRFFRNSSQFFWANWETHLFRNSKNNNNNSKNNNNESKHKENNQKEFKAIYEGELYWQKVSAFPSNTPISYPLKQPENLWCSWNRRNEYFVCFSYLLLWKVKQNFQIIENGSKNLFIMRHVAVNWFKMECYFNQSASQNSKNNSSRHNPTKKHLTSGIKKRGFLLI